MKRSRHTFLLFVALLLAWAQVLAAPFLPCRHVLAGALVAPADAVVHAAVQSGSAAAHADHVHQHAAVDTAAALQQTPVHQHTPAAASADCDPDCRLQCVTAVIVALPALSFAAGEDAALTLPAANDPFLPLQPPAVHFRPPQTA